MQRRKGKKERGMLGCPERCIACTVSCTIIAMARVTTYTELRTHLKSYCDEVAETGEPLIINRRGGADVALVSLDELVGLEETAHLLRSPRNASRLLESIQEVRSGAGTALTVEELRDQYGLNEP
jgi:antitoxin YefM